MRSFPQIQDWFVQSCSAVCPHMAWSKCFTLQPSSTLTQSYGNYSQNIWIDPKSGHQSFTWIHSDVLTVMVVQLWNNISPFLFKTANSFKIDGCFEELQQGVIFVLPFTPKHIFCFISKHLTTVLISHLKPNKKALISLISVTYPEF